MDFKLLNQMTGLKQSSQIQTQRVVNKSADTDKRTNLQIRDPQRFKLAQQNTRQLLGTASSVNSNATEQLQQLGQLTGDLSETSPETPQTSGGFQGLKKLGSTLLGKIEQANPNSQSLSELGKQQPTEKFSIALEKLVPGLQGTLELDIDGMAQKITDDIMQNLGLNNLAERLLKESNLQQSGKGTMRLNLQEIDPRLKGTVEIKLDDLLKDSQNQLFSIPSASTPVIQRVRNLSVQAQEPQTKQLNPQPSIPPTSLAVPTGRPVISAKPTLNISDQQAEKAGETFRNKLQDRLKKAVPNSPVGQYHVTSKLLNEYALYEQTGQGPLANDPQARELVQANRKFLQDKVKKLGEEPSVKMAFKAAREDALKATFGPQHATIAKHYANHLLSDEFAESIKKLPPDKQKEVLLKTTLKLSALDPQLADQTMKALIVKQMEGKLIQNLNAPGSDGDKARSALRATVKEALGKQFSDSYDHADKIAKMTDQMMDAFQKNPRLLLSKDGFAQALNEGMQALKKSGDIPARQIAELQDSLKGLRAANVTGSLLSKAALVNGAYLLSNANNTEQVLKGLGNMASGVAGLESLGKILNLGSESAMMSKLAKAKAFGPLGDALGVAADIAGAINEGKNEDRVGQALKTLSAVSGTAGALAGVAVLAGASGPLAPLVVGGAAIVGMGLSVADYFFAESDKTGEVRQALRNTGISAQQDKIKAQYNNAAGYLYDDPQQMLKDFRQLDSPADKVRYINQLLDNKDVWISKGRANVSRQMLESLSGAEINSLIQNGLHMSMLGRKVGFSPEACTGIAHKLMAVNTATGKQALQEFLSGLNTGKHSSTLQNLLGNPVLGEKMLSQFSAENVKDLIKNAPDGKTAVKILEHTNWKQFNQIIQGTDGQAFLNGIKRQLLGTSDTHLIGKMVTWGREIGAEPATRKKLEDWFQNFLQQTMHANNYAPAMNTFIKALQPTELQQLSLALKKHLASAQAAMPGHYHEPEVLQKLKEAGIR